MCGIFGIIGNGKINIDRSLASIKHRGPDDQGQYRDNNIILGFRRLSIIDLSPKGHQPMSNEDSHIWIVFNGEIYNYQELRQELSSKHNFKSNADTEVLIHGYEEWGIKKLLDKINGMFAFCLYDKNKNKAILARDRIGKKPLYYYCHDEYIAFSSEVKAFFKLKGAKFTIDQDAFNLWVGFPYLPDNERTLIEQVYKIPPASYLETNLQGTYVINKYWELPRNKINLEFDQAKKQLENLLIDSVNRRLIADVPIGILLSGGLDSSLITALAAKYSKKPIKTITVSFKNSVINEGSYARIVAKYCKTNHINLTLDVNNVYKELKTHIDIYDDLSTVDSGLLSTYLLSKKVRKLGIKVILVGEGADEIFGGYSWFQLSQYPFRLLPDLIKTQLYYYAIARILPNKQFFRYSQYLYKKLQISNMGFFDKLQRYEICHSLPNHYCMKVDKATMASSIEARAPYMDYRITELAVRLPNNYLNEKYIIRRIAEKYLPKKIYNRKKKGGMIPVYDLLNKGLKEDHKLILNNEYIVKYFGYDYLSSLINSNPTLPFLKWQREWILWKCLIFSLWFRDCRIIT